MKKHHLNSLILLLCSYTTASGNVENWFFDYALGEATVEYVFYDTNGNKTHNLKLHHYGEYKKERDEYLTIISRLTEKGRKAKDPSRMIWKKEGDMIIGKADSKTDPDDGTVTKTFIVDYKTMRYEFWTPEWLAVKGTSRLVGNEVHSKETGFTEDGAVLFTAEAVMTKREEPVGSGQPMQPARKPENHLHH